MVVPLLYKFTLYYSLIINTNTFAFYFSNLKYYQLCVRNTFTCHAFISVCVMQLALQTFETFKKLVQVTIVEVATDMNMNICNLFKEYHGTSVFVHLIISLNFSNELD